MMCLYIICLVCIAGVPLAVQSSTYYNIGHSSFEFPSFCICIEEISETNGDSNNNNYNNNSNENTNNNGNNQNSQSKESSKEATNEISAVFKRDSLNETVAETVYTLYSVIFPIDPVLGYCVTDSMAIQPFPSFKNWDFSTDNGVTQQDMFEATAFVHFQTVSGLYSPVCISYVLNSTV